MEILHRAFRNQGSSRSGSRRTPILHNSHPPQPGSCRRTWWLQQELLETGLVGRFDSFSQEESEKDPRKGKEKNGGGRPEGEAEEGRKAGEDSEDAEAVGGI